MERVADKLKDLLDKSYSPFHVVLNMENELLNKGFIKLDEKENFNITAGKKYFVTRNDSSVIAFKIPENLTEFALQITATHTDSPSFKIKPNPVIRKLNSVLLNVEPYGGMIYSTWFDKPLSIAGRVMVKEDNKIETHLLAVDEDLLIIPNVAIHMNREINSGYIYNPSRDLIPLLGTNISDDFDFNKFLLRELNIDKGEIIGHDLFLYNRQKASFIGYDKSLFASMRLDDLSSSYTALLGFLDGKNSENISLFASFDNEEVGSLTKQGANSTFLKDTIKRIIKALGGTYDDFEKIASKSVMISIDNAHANHPNRLDLSDSTTNVMLNNGIVIKYNANQSYTTDSYSSAIVKAICQKNKQNYQEFTNRSDLRGGSTLGNLSNSEISLTCADIGIAQLAMHSSYEVLGTSDIEEMKKFVETFYSTTIELNGNSINLK